MGVCQIEAGILPYTLVAKRQWGRPTTVEVGTRGLVCLPEVVTDDMGQPTPPPSRQENWFASRCRKRQQALSARSRITGMCTLYVDRNRRGGVFP
jgi:hypothetical protein